MGIVDAQKDSPPRPSERSTRLAYLTGRKVRPGMRWLAVAAILAISPAGSSLAATMISAGSTPAQGHAEVIAQCVAKFDQGNLMWHVSQESAPTKAKRVNPAAPGFVLPMAGEILLVDSDDEDMTRLAVSEAGFVRAGERQTRQTLEPKSTDYYLIEIMKGSDGDDPNFHSEQFASLEGLRDVLETEDETTIPDSEAPVLILVTDGQIEVKAKGQNDALTLSKGQAETFHSEITLSSAIEAGGAFVAAVVGPEIALPQSTPEDVPPPQVNSESIPESDSVPFDGDADGLEDALEPDYGADPTVQDTDQDGLRDDDEVYIYSTNPTIADTDVDGISDHDEIIRSNTSPTVSDSDADGLIDGEEILSAGTDPNNPDSDGDGISDGDEINIHLTNPLSEDSDQDGATDFYETFSFHTDGNNPDADGDGINDGDEIFTYVGLDPLNPDSDGDSLIDGEELPTYGSSPTMADTDGDGFDDGTEVNSGTDPADATSHP
jgi:hypothetical protein